MRRASAANPAKETRIITTRKRRRRTRVTLYLRYALTRAGWEAIIDAFERRGSFELSTADRRGYLWTYRHAAGTLPTTEAEGLVNELLVIVANDDERKTSEGHD